MTSSRLAPGDWHTGDTYYLTDVPLDGPYHLQLAIHIGSAEHPAFGPGPYDEFNAQGFKPGEWAEMRRRREARSPYIGSCIRRGRLYVGCLLQGSVLLHGVVGSPAAEAVGRQARLEVAQ